MNGIESGNDTVRRLQPRYGEVLPRLFIRLWDMLLFRCAHHWPVRQIYNTVGKRRYNSRPLRQLEIGPGRSRIKGFETLNIRGGLNVDYVANAALPLPLKDNSFELIYASHVLEHIPWFRTVDVINDWVSKLKPGGTLEVWVPNGVKIVDAFLAAEREGSETWKDDRWFRLNASQDPCLWAAGRLFCYGDGTNATDHPNWHRALFSVRWLKRVFELAGLENIRILNETNVRGASHGWINMGIAGEKRRS